jgi:hypothetical protein
MVDEAVSGLLAEFDVVAESYLYLLSRNPPAPGAPLDMNESDATQNVYATYGQYQFLRQVYQKYDPTR